ncbi:MAG: hypothetical protein GW802_22220, partial [Armatimonadetes bacterium]|nr:hypothetical protein [Armatimonadota bacterium]
HRNMYNLTGLPGWMRFGYSPGWVGRSATGLGPCASYLMTGQWPTPPMQAAWQAGPGAAFTPGAMPFGPGAATGPQPTPDQEKQWLQSQVQLLQQQLDQLNGRLAELGTEKQPE